MAKKPAPLFQAACKFGRAGFGAHTGSIGVTISEKAVPEAKRHLFIGTTLEVSLSLDPEPGNQQLDGMDDAWEEVQLRVSAKRISVSDADVSFGLTFDKDLMTGDQAKRFAGKGGSIRVLQQIDSSSADAA